jgi:uncharacterized protein (UPF0335 family)
MVKTALKEVANDNGDEDEIEDHQLTPEDEQYLALVYKRLKKLDSDLVDLKRPVNKKNAEIAGVYAELRKKGFDSEVVKIQHKRGDKFDHNFSVRWNRYGKAAKLDLPLFEGVEDNA